MIAPQAASFFANDQFPLLSPRIFVAPVQSSDPFDVIAGQQSAGGRAHQWQESTLRHWSDDRSFQIERRRGMYKTFLGAVGCPLNRIVKMEKARLSYGQSTELFSNIHATPKRALGKLKTGRKAASYLSRIMVG